MFWQRLKTWFTKRTQQPTVTQASPLGTAQARLRRRSPGPSKPPHRSDPTVNKTSSQPMAALALNEPPPLWRQPDGGWELEAQWRPKPIKRRATLDYRTGYPEVWKLDGRMREVSKPYKLRSNMARVGFDDLPNLEGPPLPPPAHYFNGQAPPAPAPKRGPGGPGKPKKKVHRGVPFPLDDTDRRGRRR